MHHFVYPSKDTYISNRPNFTDKNFGIDELLQIGTSNVIIRNLNPTKTYSYINTIFEDYSVQYFTGIFTGSINGTVASLNGTLTGSGLVFSVSYFSGSINGTSSGSYSGSISGSANGTITGSLITTGFIGIFTGQLTGSVGCLNGTASGIDVRNEQNWTDNVTKYVDRSLIQFDLTAISQSISNGSIPNPNFSLKIKVCKESELPINYTIYALPISQSWNMGDGYFSDGGSDTGVNWQYFDNNFGTQWYNTFTSSLRPPIDFVSSPQSATASFSYGGGTWYIGQIASQSFNYESSDINMDVTSIVMSWISGSIPNQGFLLVSSDELQSTGSGFVLQFFSRDTNTIYSPYLDVKWLGNGNGGTSNVEFITGSLFTSSIVVSTLSSGMNVTIQTGSSFSISDGVNGIFSGSTFLLTSTHYVTSSYGDIFEAVELFTGSFTGSFVGSAINVFGTLTGSGWFTSSYFSGSVDGISFISNNTGISSSNIVGAFVSGSINTTGSLGTFSGQLTSSYITLSGNATGYFLDLFYNLVDGIVDGKGLSGDILNVPVVGNYEGIMTNTLVGITGSCGNSFNANLVTASFTTGIFSGSSFTAYFTDDQKLENAILSGSWTNLALLGATVSIPIPSGIDPFAYAYVSGSYISGRALGIYTISGSVSGSFGSNSASFVGQFVDGNLRGGYLNLQLSGSVLTSSYSYTSSVIYSSTNLNALDTSNPFTVVIKNLFPEYKAGDIVKIGVFGRKQFPLKTFGISSQLSEYLVPEYLPTSSFYALKDNETGEIILDFDNYTCISCDYPSGNYFVIDTTGFPQERFYRILIRVENSGSIYTMDCGKIFKITR